MNTVQTIVGVSSFRGPYAFLSNFHPAPIAYGKVVWPTAEHMYQAAKSTDRWERDQVRSAETPGQAKRMGKHITLRKDWSDEKRLEIMETIVRMKFQQNPDLAQMLLDTEDMELVEGNNWNDRFWGMVWNANKVCWEGENHLGKILMKIREELRKK